MYFAGKAGSRGGRGEHPDGRSASRFALPSAGGILWRRPRHRRCRDGMGGARFSWIRRTQETGPPTQRRARRQWRRAVCVARLRAVLAQIPGNAPNALRRTRDGLCGVRALRRDRPPHCESGEPGVPKRSETGRRRGRCGRGKREREGEGEGGGRAEAGAWAGCVCGGGGARGRGGGSWP